MGGDFHYYEFARNGRDKLAQVAGTLLLFTVSRRPMSGVTAVTAGDYIDVHGRNIHTVRANQNATVDESLAVFVEVDKQWGQLELLGNVFSSPLNFSNPSQSYPPQPKYSPRSDERSCNL